VCEQIEADRTVIVFYFSAEDNLRVGKGERFALRMPTLARDETAREDGAPGFVA
jgi:hypothetical protein